MSEITAGKKSDESPSKYPLVYIRGLPFPSPFFVVETIEKVLDFKPNESDIFIVTYPKCGTTWTQFMVWEILNKGAVPPSPNEMMFQYAPFLEVIGVNNLETLPSPRIFKTHLPFDLQPYNPSSKYIYIARNPWDVCVSYYYHHQMDPNMPRLSFSEHVDQFIAGQIGWGDYLNHVLSWYKHRTDSNVLFLTYENMKENKKKALLRIARFLGSTYHEILQDDDVLGNCLKFSDFKYLKEMGMFFPNEVNSEVETQSIKELVKDLGKIDKHKGNSEKFVEVNFFRKGEIGDWKNHFSSHDILKFDEYIRNKLKNTEMENFWGPSLEETSV